MADHGVFHIPVIIFNLQTKQNKREHICQKFPRFLLEKEGTSYQSNLESDPSVLGDNLILLPL